MSTGSAQVKKAQPSRKGKKAWRKNVDIAQLETGLEVLRSEERVRGTMDELPDEEYFTIDVTGDTHVKKQLKAKRQLRVDQILNEKSAVPALKGRHIQQISEPVYGTESKHQRQKINKLAKRKLKESPQPSPKKAKNKQAYDVWAVEDSNEAEQNDYLTPAKQIKVKAPSTMKKIPKAAKHHPAVAIPHAGASYNPTEEDHAKLVKEATDIEVAKQEAKKRLDEIVSYIKELDNLKHEVDNNNGDNEEDDEDEDENDENEPITKKPANRKTTAQRNKEKRKRQELAVWRKRQTEKKLKQQIDKVEELEKELAAKQQEINTMTAIRQERKEQKEKEGSKRLSKHSMGEMDLEVQLEDELAESLRQLKPEGNIFKDRYISMQKRNIIEPRVPVTHSRKYALKTYERRSYKNFTLAENKKQQLKDQQKNKLKLIE